MNDLKGFISEYSTELEDYLVNTDSLPIVVINSDLTVSAHNNCFRKIMSARDGLTGVLIKSLLMPESHSSLPIDETVKASALMLSFKTLKSSTVHLYCHVVRVNQGKHIIFGGKLMLTNEKTVEKISLLSNEMANMARDLHKKNKELQEAQSQIKILSGIIPICSYCKEIRDDKGYWNQLEKFISDNSEAEFSHGICDKCIEIHYPDD